MNFIKKYQETIVVIVFCIIIIGLISWGLSYRKNTVAEKLSKTNFELPDYTLPVKSKTISPPGNALGDGAIISRPIKGLGGYKHYGVMLKNKVVHFNQHGLHVDQIDNFADGSVIKVTRPGLTGNELAKFYKRYEKICKRYGTAKYDAINNNCEHFVNELIYGRKISMQSNITKDMIVAYDTVVRNKLIQNKLGMLIPAYDIAIKKLKTDTLKTN